MNGESMRPRQINVVTKTDEPQLERYVKIASAAIMPFAVLLGTYWIQSALQSKVMMGSIASEAIKILQNPSVDPGLRVWACDVLKIAGVGVDAELRERFETGEVSFPVCTNDSDCDDGDACTLDACNNGNCDSYVVVYCDDGIFCNGLETCDADIGECVEGEPPCHPEDDPNYPQRCDEDTLVCVDLCVTAEDCDDLDPCTLEICDPITRECVSEVIVCEHMKSCFRGICYFRCEAHPDCSESDTCVYDVCLKKCAVNADCGAGESCEDKHCVPPG